MARPGWPERNRAARSFRQLRRFHHVINSDKVFGTHRLWPDARGRLLALGRRPHTAKIEGRLRSLAGEDRYSNASPKTHLIQAPGPAVMRPSGTTYLRS